MKEADTHPHRLTVHMRSKTYNRHQMAEHSDLNTYHLAALGIQMTSDLCLSLGSEALVCYQFTINLSSCSNFHHKSNYIHSHLCYE